MDGRVAVFGFPNGAADTDDFVGVLHGDRVVAPLKDSAGMPLQFTQSPIVAGNAIVGLAQAVDQSLMVTGARFIYRVTATGVDLQPIESNVAFVTYSPERRAIGWGIADKDGVSVRYDGNVTHPVSLAEPTATPRRK